ncbi:MAG: hypothetical protein A2Y33_15315 [Spirochaetes bacterium GWF1_51_8]|nr:MAG: hypothetical protein A2Y33_15315 [Spirochaetes bacterium GWF1_51_8]
MKHWRLSIHGALDAPLNMAIDETLWESVRSGVSLPSIRFYSWYPASFSIGRFQKPDSLLDLDACARSGIRVVRRMTGGGAIYHNNEITYSLACPLEILGVSSVKDGYRKLTGFILNSYRKLGLDADYIGRKTGEKTSAYCFSGLEEYDIAIDGKKIGGNAQRIMGGIVFQHGSIPISIAHDDYAKYLKPDVEHQMENFTSLSRHLNPMPDTGDLVEVLIESFSETMCAELDDTDLSRDEWELAERLVFEKYSADEWNTGISQTRAEVIR